MAHNKSDGPVGDIKFVPARGNEVISLDELARNSVKEMTKPKPEDFKFAMPESLYKKMNADRLEKQLSEFGIYFERRNQSLVFFSKEYMDDALLEVYRTGHDHGWAIECYLDEQGIITKPNSKGLY